MNKKRKKELEASGWKVGDAADFLELDPEEAELVEIKVALARELRRRRTRKRLTQVQLARTLGSSQSRVAKMEVADPTVSVDLLLRALLALGASMRDVGKLLAPRAA